MKAYQTGPQPKNCPYCGGEWYWSKELEQWVHDCDNDPSPDL